MTYYTVTYNYNYSAAGIYITQTSVLTGARLTTAQAEPSRSGYTFIGWYKDTACVNPWKFSTDTVTAGTNLYAKWAASTYTVEGTVVDDASLAVVVSGATVRVIQGNVQFGNTVTTNSSGGFTVTRVPNGTYNLIVTKDNQEVTICIEVKGDNYTSADNIILSSGNKNSKLDIIGSETPNVVDGNLMDVFNDPNVFNSSDEDIINDNGTVEIKLTVHQNDNSENKLL